MSIIPEILAVEAAIDGFDARSDVSPSLAAVRDCAAVALARLLDPSETVRQSKLDAVIEQLLVDPKPKRDALLLTARLLDVTDLLPSGSSDGLQFQRRFATLFERIVPDLSKILDLAQCKQTIDKIHAISGLQGRAAQLLEPLSSAAPTSSAFTTGKQFVYRALSVPLLKSYLHPYAFAERSASIREIQTSIEDLLECKDATFALKIEQCEQKLTEAGNEATGNRDLFSRLGFQPFLANARAVLEEVRAQSVDRFQCAIRTRRPIPNVIERRFPLHEANRIFRATIPFVNDGPGLALDTVVTLVSDTDALVVQNERIAVGAVEPGEFAVTLDLLVGDPTREVKLLVEVQWSTAHSLHREDCSFEAVLAGQNPDVAWETLEIDDPYSIEVAHGDEFVGRRAKVTTLGGRLRRSRMQSSYITGQKRVGKTSLAFAVKDHVGATEGGENFEFIYLEYGEYARSDAGKTVQALGAAIANRLMASLPPDLRTGPLDFEGSIAPLNQLSQSLEKFAPNKRFVIILDEFDEIHPEMYRFGPLAEAFFSNVRTFSAKPNIALMLVGGENMPFIISAQGDQLNKFVPEQLSYFSRSSEWEDFLDIVRLRGDSPLNWYEAALSEIFRIANGHPYYTKLLCARIFQNAVGDRDTEVTVDEVTRALRNLIEGLDINAFAHFWKDGIAAERNEAEITELKRKRVLVALGQTKRAGLPLSTENIATNVRNLSIAPSEVPSILTDFVRRDILRERNGEYGFILPLFDEWLVQKGVGKLIADTLGDDMAEALRAVEDEAFVGAGEIATAIEGWPPYMGRQLGVGDIQAWLDQRKSFRERRLLFKLIQNMRFIREEEVREKLRVAHSMVKQHVGAFTPKNRSERRFDIAVTYVDGVAKSGAKYAEKYAEENLISTTCVIEPSDIATAITNLESRRGKPMRGLVIVDDIAATGTSLASDVGTFVTRNRTFLAEKRLPVIVVALLATEIADQAMRMVMARFDDIDIDFRACEHIRETSLTFSAGSLVWSDAEESARAKALIGEIGRSVCKPAPLGFGDLGLRIAFTDTVPNNTLPVLHASDANWRALLPRPKN